MELEQQVGQLFLIGFHGTTMTNELREVIKYARPGGLILFKRNIEHPRQIAELCLAVQRAAKDFGGLPMYIAIDQEGGVVARLSEPFTTFPSQGELENAHYDDIVQRGRIMARELTLVGINLNLAPVLDVRRPEDSTKNYWRSFSEDPHKVASLGVALIDGLQRNGVMACAKHFPGLGKAQIDPHIDLPIVEGDLENDLVPFRAAISQGVGAVMMSHAIYPAIDPEFQASISRSAIETLLRGRLGYQGVVVTDDLEMGALSKRLTIEECSLAAFDAGADVLLICSRLEKIPDCFDVIRDAVEKSENIHKKLEAAMTRLISVKRQYVHPFETPDFVQIQSYFTQNKREA